MRSWTIAAVAAAVLAGGGAATVPAAAQAPQDEVDPAIADGSAQQALGAARDRWQATGLRSYRYRASRQCFCTAQFTRPGRVVVRRGRTIEPPRRLRAIASVPRLFHQVQKAIDDRVASLTVRYGGRGVPRTISVDVSRMIADEEYGFAVRRFRPL